MGGKRPDQHNIDPREAGATDYKNLPQKGHGGSSLDDTVTLDKQRLAQSQQQAEGQPFLPDVPAPSVHANQARNSQADGSDSESDSAAGNP